MKIGLSIAERLQKLLSGEEIPASKCKNSIFRQMLQDEVLFQKRKGSGKVVFLPNPPALRNYLKNKFGINDLDKYIHSLKDDTVTRSQMVRFGSDSKSVYKRTFKGFLINSYQPIPAIINNKEILITGEPGTFTYIYDFENFIPDTKVTVVGIENAENFRFIKKQKYLFGNITPLFVSRYPQSKDLINWLQNIHNNYLHYGDFDFEGINIYLNEYKKYLGERANYFIPENIEELLQKFGNRDLYNKQYERRTNPSSVDNHDLGELIDLFHKYKKVLEQEVLIK